MIWKKTKNENRIEIQREYNCDERVLMHIVFMFTQPVLYALLATIFTWGVTAVGAAGVFVFRKVNQKLLDGMLGFTAGVMIAASF